MGSDLRVFVRSSLGRLTASYLLIIMIMSIGFSVVLYRESSRELGRQIPSQTVFDQRGFGYRSEVHDFFEDRIAEGRRVLLARLVLLNMVTCIAGAGLSYYLAKKTLEPIEENMEAQSQFISDASHELRTPLTALRTTNEVALRRSKLSAADAKDLLQANLEEVIKLQQLTDSLLRLATRTEGQLAVAHVPLQLLITDVVQAMAPAAALKHIEIQETIPDMQVSVDKEAFSQVITILLDNAIKYSPNASTVRVAAVAKNKSLELTVKDQGIGIKAVDLPHIFDRFYRADHSRTRQQVEGYGIGLSLAQKIVQQHGGTITAKSKPGSGATFTVRIPIS